jgi:hypothetical protein
LEGEREENTSVKRKGERGYDEGRKREARGDFPSLIKKRLTSPRKRGNQDEKGREIARQNQCWNAGK